MAHRPQDPLKWDYRATSATYGLEGPALLDRIARCVGGCVFCEGVTWDLKHLRAVIPDHLRAVNSVRL